MTNLWLQCGTKYCICKLLLTISSTNVCGEIKSQFVLFVIVIGVQTYNGHIATKCELNAFTSSFKHLINDI